MEQNSQLGFQNIFTNQLQRRKNSLREGRIKERLKEEEECGCRLEVFI